MTKRPPPHPPSRRDVLRRAAWTTAGLSLGGLPAFGCRDAQRPSADATAAASAADIVGTADAGVFSSLRAALEGPLLVPGDAAFADAARTFHVRHDGVLPAAVARCASTADVQAAVHWAREAKVPVRLRAGGHSYAGYCKATGVLVIDVRGLSEVDVDEAAGTVTVGAGATLIDVQAALWPRNLALPTGSCPTVGVTGLALGGGWGLMARRFGMTCDVLHAVDIVLADGSLVTAHAGDHAELFWACRGGGGGNFGAVTRLVFDVSPVEEAATIILRWPWSEAASVVDAWQRWAPTAPHALTANLHLAAGGAGGAEPRTTVVGAWIGDLEGAKAQVAALEAAGAPKVASPIIEAAPYGQAAKSWVDCDAVVAHCRLAVDTPEGQVERGTYHARSDYMSELLPPAGITALLEAIASRVGAPTPGLALLDPYGGAIADVAPDATAFVHRGARFSAQYLAFGTSDAPAGADDPWLAALHAAMRPYASGAVYQNYIDAELEGWADAYYGANLARLRAVKEAYDPNGFFDFPQAIG